jgi:hypothetical protein
MQSNAAKTNYRRGIFVTRNTTHGARRTVLTIMSVVAVAIAIMAVASSAYAAEHHPKGEFAPFAECPYTPEANNCIVAVTEGGEFIIGNQQVPITNPITLQGGINGFFSGSEHFVAAENGNTLTKSPQKVPGGLAGLFRCNEIGNFLERIACEITFENGLTGVNATTELAAPASSIGLNTPNLITATGTALSLPLKVHLENPFLGSSCYIGSNAHPVVIDFTTGTTSPPAPNKPITGNPGESVFNEAGTMVTISHNVLVNNSFAAPEAQGCGGLFAFLIDPLIDSKLGLPAAAGKNTAILKGTLKVALAEAVKASE